MTYEEAEKYIEQTNIRGSVYGLDVMRELLRRLDNPQDKIKVIHVAGTNGKGSICAFLDSILEDAGYNVGRYVSPTIFTYLERFQINGVYMEPDEFAGILEPVKAASDAMEADGMRRPTSYETETAVAFCWCLKRDVDFLILETGMGGLEDATNVCAHPVCTVIASISMDHMQQLGSTLSEIYRHKLGIMRPGVPCAAYPVNEDSIPLWLEKCGQMSGDIPSVMLDIGDVDITDCDESGSVYRYRGERYEVSVPGIYQIYNSAVAVLAAHILQKTGYDLENVNIQRGIKNTRWPGRFQMISSEPEIYVDGAHNEGGWRALRASMDRYFSERDIIHVCGVLRDKDYRSMLDIMLDDRARAFIAVQPDSPRALDCNTLAELAKEHIDSVYVQPDAVKAVEYAESMATAGKATTGKATAGRATDNTAMECKASVTAAGGEVSELGDKPPVIMVYGSLSFIGPVIERFQGR